jgi:Flp pilus assembly protein TadD
MVRRFLSHSPLLLAVSALALVGAPAVGQEVVQPTAETPAIRAVEALSRHVRALTENPRDLNALIGAGEAALVLRDVNAAVGFLGKADEISPRNGRVKAGLARSLLIMENPRDALRLFDDATDLGVPHVDVAGDRGLAYDLRGDTRRAQRDYALALTRGPDDEITRRYALSLGISGDRDQAIALLTPLLYKRDQGAWRARAFVLALTGDRAGAVAIVRQVMPERQASLMEPYLDRLPKLKAADKAMAVHLGHFPVDGERRVARAPEVADPDRPTVSSSVAPASVSRAPRRRPGVAEAAPTPAPAPARMAPAPNEDVLAAIIRDIDVTATAPPRAAPAATPASAPKAAPPAKKAEPKKPEPRHPARHWVQVAGGANKQTLPREWTRLKKEAPAVFKGRTAWTVPLRATNRLLAGPFETTGAAQDFVNDLRKAGLAAFVWTSAAGQEIEKLATP